MEYNMAVVKQFETVTLIFASRLYVPVRDANTVICSTYVVVYKRVVSPKEAIWCAGPVY